MAPRTESGQQSVLTDPQELANPVGIIQMVESLDVAYRRGPEA